MRKLPFSIFLNCVKISLIAIFLGVAMEFAVVALQVLSGRAIGELINGITNNEIFFTSSLWILLALLLMSVIVEPFLFFAYANAINSASFAFHRFVVKNFLDKQYNAAQDIGSAIGVSRWENDVLEYNGALTGAITKLLLVAVSIMFIVLFAFNNVSYALVCVIISLISGTISIFFKKVEERLYVNNRDYEEEKRKNLFTIINNYVFLSMHSILDNLLDSTKSKMNEQYKKVTLPNIRTKTLKNNVEFFSNTIGYLIIVFYGISTKANIGSITFYLMLVTPLRTIVSAIVAMTGNFMRFKLLYKRIEVFFTEKENTSNNHLPDSISEISAERLSYEIKGKPILRDITFSIKMPGAVLISGKNGTGKSTLAKLIVALYQSDSIKVNGQRYVEINYDSIRSKISYSEQKPFFFQSSIRETLKAVNPNVTDDKIREYMDLLCLKKDLDYKLHDGGENLSGGERQKLSLIRALVKGDDVLLLDEPTNHLDNDSMYGFKQIIANHKQIILISHDRRILDIRDFNIIKLSRDL